MTATGPRVAALSLGLVVSAASGQTVLFDPDLEAEVVVEGLGTAIGELTTAFVFVDDSTVLVVSRGDGRVRRVDLVPGGIATPGATVLDLDVISPGNNGQTEYGVQGMTRHPDFESNGLVYIRYDRSLAAGADTPEADVVLGPNFSASLPTLNVIERFVWDGAANGGDGALVFDAGVHAVTFDTRYHHGGPMAFADDDTLLAIHGDLRRTTGLGWQAATAGPLLAANAPGGVADDPATVVRLEDDGSTPGDNPFDPADPGVPAEAARWFAYGVRNSFGLAVDPVTGAVWDTENGEAMFDEVNRLPPGANSGWSPIMGPLDHPDVPDATGELVALPGSSYADPAFAWRTTIGVTDLHFLHGSALGPAYDDAVLVGCVNGGHLWAFRLAPARDAFVFTTAALQDRTDDRPDPIETPVGPDAEEIVLGILGGPGVGTLAIESDPAGHPCVLTTIGRIYRLRRSPPAADLDGDGLVGVGDVLTVLGEWGPCPAPCPGPGAGTGACPDDADCDCVVGVGDLLAVLAAWGAPTGVDDLLDVLAAWGACPGPCTPVDDDCPADLDGDGAVGVGDLLLVLAAWGP
ncbi:MAG: PQQ-dependent sugar dehydrogenase [Planctomycetota bacterium]